MEKQDLFHLVEQGDSAGLEAAIAAGADAKVRDGSGVSLLYAAAERGDAALVALLLSSGAEVDRSSDAGNTPLMAACAKGSAPAVEALLAAGADPAHRNKWGLTSRDWAKWAESTEEILSLLRHAGRA
jgi:ankyrin repeat protein